MKITKETQVHDLIPRVDSDRENIPRHLSLKQLRIKMTHGEDFYDVCNVDSVTRETVFSALSEAYGIDYDTVYYCWLYNDIAKVVNAHRRAFCGETDWIRGKQAHAYLDSRARTAEVIDSNGLVDRDRALEMMEKDLANNQ